MFQTIIAGLALALVTGLTFVAYKHPLGYRRLCLPLIGLVFVVYIVWAAYDGGFTNGFYTAVDGVRELNKDKIVVTPLHQTLPIWVILTPLLIIGYLAFLVALPSILDLKESADEP